LRDIFNYFKKIIMRTILRIFIPLFILLMFGCQRNMTDSGELSSDDQLIMSIQNATDKQEIDTDQLPLASREVLDRDYVEHITVGASMAPELGYEVLLGGMESRMGDRSEAYFDLEGRELRDSGSARDEDERDREQCFELVYPVTFIMPDRSTITIDNEEDWGGIRSWYEANPGSEERPALQYPVEISFDEEETLTIDNEDEMRRVYEYCDGEDEYDRECFELVLPVTFVMPDGSSITIDNEEDWGDLRGWYEANPGSEEEPALQYPVDIVYETDDGTVTVTINNDAEMDAAEDECEEEDRS